MYPRFFKFPAQFLDSFRCRKDDTCIEKENLCNGNKDCGDGSDEDRSTGGICRKFILRFLVVMYQKNVFLTYVEV